MSKRNDSRRLFFSSGHRRPQRSLFRRSLGFEPLEDRRLLATLTVNTLSDIKLAGDGLVSLREAILAANSNTATDLGEIGSGADTIVFAPGLSGTMTLTAGEMLISEALTITGPGQDLLTIEAHQVSRVFNITATTGDFAISGMVLNGGASSQNGGAVRSASSGRLTMDHVTVSGSSTTGNTATGGGIYALNLALTNSVVNGNSVSGTDPRGGGVHAGKLLLTDSIISDNTGGGVYTYNATIAGCTISGNSSGGILARFYPQITVSNCTITNNQGTGISIGQAAPLMTGSLTVNDSTISHNGRGMSIYGALTISKSTVSDNIGDGIYSRSSANINACQLVGNGGSGFYGYFGGANVSDSTISGNGRSGLVSRYGGFAVTNSTISNNRGDRGAGIDARSGNVSISGSTVSGNQATGSGGGIYSESSSITIISSILSNNTSGGSGGAFRSLGACSVLDSLITGNSAGRYGGGAYVGLGAKFTNSTISGNSSGRSGGGVIGGSMTLTGSTVSGNVAHAGGGGLYGGFTLISSTVSGNRVIGTGGMGGGIVGSGTLFSSTVTDNFAAGHGGGIFSYHITLRNSIVAGNTAGQLSPDFSLGTVFQSTIVTHNSLIGDNEGTPLLEAQTFDANGNLIGSSAGGGIIDPLLAPLRNNGGPTMTHALLPGSPALDAIPYNPLLIPEPVHKYQLNNSLADAMGGPSLVSSGGTLQATGYKFAKNKGLSLSSANISSSMYTIEIVFSWDVLSGTYQKILDFRNLASDTGLYTLGSGLNFVNGAFAPDLFAAGQLRTLVLTRDDVTDMVAAYIDGNQVWSFVDSAGDAVFGAANRIIRFFQDDTASGQTEAQSGFVDRIRIFDVALNAAQVLGLIDGTDELPPFDQRGEPYARVVDYDGIGGARVDMGAYESQGVPSFSLGDYSKNGAVDAADYAIWRNSLGTVDVEPFSGADGNGDGKITPEDYTVWKSNFGDGLTITLPIASGAGAGSALTGALVDAAIEDAAIEEVPLALGGGANGITKPGLLKLAESAAAAIDPSLLLVTLRSSSSQDRESARTCDGLQWTEASIDQIAHLVFDPSLDELFDR